MSSSTYKGGLAVSGSALEKSKLQLRRPTPDSDVLASSDDDRDHVPAVVRPAPGGYPGGRRPSSGWLQDIQPNRKFSLPSASFAASQPTTPSLELPQQTRAAPSAFPWNTNSFTSGQASSRLKEVLPSPTSAHPPASERPLPSPTTVEGDEGIGFLLNQQNPNPLRKAVRSQSYSIGQGDVENSPIGQFSATRSRPGIRHRPSKPSLLGAESAIGLSQLREDEVDEVESSNGSEHGVRLPVGYWEREQKQDQLKQTAIENARARNRATSTGSPVSQQRRKNPAGLRNVAYGNATEYAIDELDDPDSNMDHPGLSRRFSEHASVLSREPEAEKDSAQKQQWATGNIPTLGLDALGRRHSFAHYGSYNHSMPVSTLGNTQEEDEDAMSPLQSSQSPQEPEPFDTAAYFTGYGPLSRAINKSAVSAAHPDPIMPNKTMSASNAYTVPQVMGRPGRRLFIVTFKCSRADIYYVYDNTGLEIRRGDLVIVEGDRGCDLGQVTHADVSMEDAKKFKGEANEEHFRWLVMFSQYSLAGTSNESGMLGALARANGMPNPMSRSQMTGMGSQQDQDAKPKMIKRVAQPHEVMGLRDKEGQEAKSKRLGAQKAAEHKLPMEILDAEYQADYHKLTYFYYAESYVNFNDLVTDLFKQYKVRIWMSAVNPASVVNPAGMMQIPPPSAIGPGAILNSSNASAALPVGPGFGSNTHRSNENFGHQAGRRRGNAPHANYDDGYHAFSHQIPNYAAQPSYNMPPWANNQQLTQHMYDRYSAFALTGGYPGVTASGSPMNYGAYYPPTTFAATPAYNVAAGGPYRAGYPSSSNNTVSQSHVSTVGPSSGQYSTSGITHPALGANFPHSHGGGPNAPNVTSNASQGTPGTPGNHGNGHVPTSGASYNGAYDAAFLAAMHNLSFGAQQ